MAYAEPAYRLDAFPVYEPQRRERPDVRVVPGGAQQTAPSSLPILIAKMAAVVLVVIAVLCFARITLTNATVNTLIESDALSAQITEARSTGTSLEMEQSALTSPNVLKGAVKRLGMYAPAEVGTLALSPDVVATDANGSLLLSDTAKNLAGTQG